MYSIEYTGFFLKQAKQCKKRGYNMALLEETIQLLTQYGKLPAKYKPHKLFRKIYRLLGVPYKVGLAFNLETGRYCFNATFYKYWNSLRHILIFI